MTVEFKAWPKIPRISKEIITITEKMDGTNSCIIIEEDKIIGIQSRKRLITPEDDNFGFAKWVTDNNEELKNLGDGYHYGEWVGPGIQKNLHILEHKSLFLFNTKRWNKDNPNLPRCCNVVRALYEGPYADSAVQNAMDELIYIADIEKYTPEGIIIYSSLTRSYSKATFKSIEGKWKEKE